MIRGDSLLRVNSPPPSEDILILLKNAKSKKLFELEVNFLNNA